MSQVKMQVKIDDKWYEVDTPVVERMQWNYAELVKVSQQHDELKAAVQEMRNKQKLYFKSPKAFNLLDDAKAAEVLVDRLLSGKPEVVSSSQKALF